ncbi:MAG: hypothetical protein L3J36_14305 [Rhodobacteraceae bacterium]|nr:hypothetical protein [Paracoccaceae bacterium]
MYAKQHHKFIALILAASVAVTSLSAVPAYADGKTARQFGWIALLAVIGLAVQDSNRKRSVTHNNYTYNTPNPPSTPPRPLPPQVSRKLLPLNCLRVRNVNGQRRELFGLRCLKQNFSYVSSLPYACQLGYSNGRGNRVGFEPLCLRERGYVTALR